jgi:hypothetical protein
MVEEFPQNAAIYQTQPLIPRRLYHLICKLIVLGEDSVFEELCEEVKL